MAKNAVADETATLPAKNAGAPAGMPQCCPYLFYEDLDATIRFLTDAFAFEKRFAHPGPDGKTCHAQLTHGTGVVMLGAADAPGALRPVKTPKKAGLVTGSVYLYVADVDAHWKRAKAAGAEVVLAPADMFWGDRIYCAVDPEGQFWTFATCKQACTA